MLHFPLYFIQMLNLFSTFYSHCFLLNRFLSHATLTLFPLLKVQTILLQVFRLIISFLVSPSNIQETFFAC